MPKVNEIELIKKELEHAQADQTRDREETTKDFKRVFKSIDKLESKQVQMDRDLHIDRVAVVSISGVLVAVFGDTFLKLMSGS